MADAAVATVSKPQLMARLKGLRSQLGNLRAAAEEGLERGVIGISAPAAGYGVGRLHGWAEKNGKDITIGGTEITYSAAGGVAATLLGAFGTKIVGKPLANLALGIGSGTLAGEAALLGRKHATAI
jgi:hypothetical protein